MSGNADTIRVLEIGCWAGASTVSWFRAFLDQGRQVHVDCVDPWLAYFDTSVDPDAHYQRMNAACADDAIFRLFNHNIKAESIDDKVSVLSGTSRERLPALPDGSYDLIYVDGSHRFEDALFDLTEAKRLLKHGGIVCGDDLELQADEVSADELSRMVASDEDYMTSTAGVCFHPGVTKAVAREVGHVSAWNGFCAAVWDGAGSRPIEAHLSAGALPLHIERALQLSESPVWTETFRGFKLFRTASGILAIRGDIPPDIAAGDLPIDIAGALYHGNDLVQLRAKIFAEISRLRPTAFDPDGPPVLVGSHRDFNLVQCEGSIVCLLDRALGPINVPADPADLVREHGVGKVLIAADLTKARTLVDQSHLVRTVETRMTSLDHGQAASEAATKAVDQRLAELESAIAALIKKREQCLESAAVQE